MNKVVELEEFYSLLHLDYKKFKKNNKFSFLFAKEQVIRGKVMVDYVEIDEFLNLCLWVYFFPKKSRIDNKAHFEILQKNKRFRRLFNYVFPYVSLRRKIELLRKIVEMPKQIDNNIRKITELRNKLAHSPRLCLQPEKSAYKDKNIFSIGGLKLFLKDSEEVQHFLVECHSNISKCIIK